MPPSQTYRYAHDPVGYAREVLHVVPWAKQIEIAEKIFTPPHKVLVKSGHSTGKTFTAAWLTNWFFDTFPESAAITTAPTHRDVCDLLWTEIRLQRRRANKQGFIGDAAPEMRSSHNHFAKGFTANSGESFQGRHFRRMLFIFDEAVGIKRVFWTTTKSMFKPEEGHFWLCFFNPTDTSSQAYAEETGGDWHVVEMSSLSHPNIVAELQGRKPDYPSAVGLSQVWAWIKDWCEPVHPSEAASTDLEFPPGSEQWWRPGPEMEARAMGRWPSQGTYGVWSDATWQAALEVRPFADWARVLPEIGCDPARYGSDFTAIHVRWGPQGMHHERHNGWDTKQTAGRLKQMCVEWAEKSNKARPPQAAPIKPQEIPVKVDADGLGVGVIDQKGDFNFLPVCGSGTPLEPARYPNRRSEGWFRLARLAKEGKLSFARLPRDVQHRLRQQAMGPTWKLDGDGLCVVERKEDTKKRLSMGSPDDMDAVSLSFVPVSSKMHASVLDDIPGTGRILAEQPKRRMRFGER